MLVKPKSSRKTGRGIKAAAEDISSAGSPQALSQMGPASNLKTLLPSVAQNGQIEAAEPNSPGKHNAANHIWICPEIPWQSEPKSRERVAELVRRFVKLPHAATLRGLMAGSKWAVEVTAFIGPQLMLPVRESLDNWLMDEENIVFLSAIHSCCFGGEMIPRREELNHAEYIRGFMLGVLRTWDGKKVEA